LPGQKPEQGGRRAQEARAETREPARDSHGRVLVVRAARRPTSCALRSVTARGAQAFPGSQGFLICAQDEGPPPKIPADVRKRISAAAGGVVVALGIYA